MNTYSFPAAAGLREPAAVSNHGTRPRSVHGAAADRHQTLQAQIDRSPRMQAQRRAMAASFGSAFQPGIGVSAPIQRIEIEEQQITRRETYESEAENGPESLEFLGYYDGAGDATEQDVIDEILAKHHGLEYRDDAAWRADVKMRAELIKGMNRINDDGLFDYNWEADQWTMPAAEWAAVPAREEDGTDVQGQDVAFAPLAGTSRLTALRNLFRAPLANEKYYFDCSTAILAVHYRALAEAMEDNLAGSFDAAKARSDVVINVATVDKVDLGAGMVDPPGNGITQEMELASVDELMPGDWVYFENFSNYNETHEGATAAWAGEHAIYMGNDNYRGFGVDAQSHEDMVDTLVTHYNNQGLKHGASRMEQDFREPSNESLTRKLPGITAVNRAERAL